jgi:SAM-dependent methyltransferase
VESARRLTEYVRLTDRVEFVEADATRLPLPDGDFTACVSQEAFVHIEDKAALLAEAFRVLREDCALAFTDWVSTPGLTEGEGERLRRDFAADGLVMTDDYRRALARAGFVDVRNETLSEQWAEILEARLRVYRDLRDETVARFGREHFERYDRNYAFFVHLVEAAKLGGARFRATRPSPTLA